LTFDLASYKIAYNLKNTGQLLLQFYRYLRSFYKLNKSGTFYLDVWLFES